MYPCSKKNFPFMKLIKHVYKNKDIKLIFVAVLCICFGFFITDGFLGSTINNSQNDGSEMMAATKSCTNNHQQEVIININNVPELLRNHNRRRRSSHHHHRPTRGKSIIDTIRKIPQDFN